MTFKLSSKSQLHLLGVDSKLIEVVNLAITLTPIDFGIPSSGGLRTAAQQYTLYKEGKSNADGYNKLSRHQLGTAFDIFAYVDGKASWDVNHLTTCATAILQAASKLRVSLEWGGLWKAASPGLKIGKDYPHFQLGKPL